MTIIVIETQWYTGNTLYWYRELWKCGQIHIVSRETLWVIALDNAYRTQNIRSICFPDMYLYISQKKRRCRQVCCKSSLYVRLYAPKVSVYGVYFRIFNRHYICNKRLLCVCFTWNNRLFWIHLPYYNNFNCHSVYDGNKMQYKSYYTLGNVVVVFKIYIKHTALERSPYILFTVCNVRIQLNDYYPK